MKFWPFVRCECVSRIDLIPTHAKIIFEIREILRYAAQCGNWANPLMETGVAQEKEINKRVIFYRSLDNATDFMN